MSAYSTGTQSPFPESSLRRRRVSAPCAQVFRRLGIGLVLLTAPSIAEAELIKSQTPPSEVQLSAEFLFPRQASRRLKTVNLDLQYPLLKNRGRSFSLDADFLISRPYGFIHPVGADNGREAESSAYGFGPGLSGDWRIPLMPQLALHLEGIVNFVVYTEKFPTGGDHYNFMWRGGPSFEFDLAPDLAFEAGYHWAHISNGQQKHSENPSYDASGVFIRGVFPF